MSKRNGAWRGAVRRRAAPLVMTPGLVAFLGSARLRDEPHRLLRWLRTVDPVHRSPFGFLVLSRHGDVEAALRDPRLGTEEANIDLDLLPRLQQALPRLRVDRPVPRHRASFTIRGYGELPVTNDGA